MLARTGRNLKTGAKVEVPAKQLVTFRPARELKLLLKHQPKR